MLSYRHGFHAANHADILKHCTLISALSLLRIKDTPLLYVDTHAGSGSYALHESYSAINEEWTGGLGRLCSYHGVEKPPEAIEALLHVLTRYGAMEREEDGKPRIPRDAVYPGSPALAAMLLRPIDRLALFELHPNDFTPLTELVSDDRRITTRNSDGLAGLRALLPPPSRRALILIDPSYELKDDYERVTVALRDALRRFATGVYVLWYPLLERDEAKSMPSHITNLAIKSLDIRLSVRRALPGSRGMSGSGMIVINPPWQLKHSLEEALPYLTRALGEDDEASWSISARGLD